MIALLIMKSLQQRVANSSYLESNTRCSRGLKVLSVKVRDIVYQKKRTSYKEVAEALISENNISGAFSPTLNVCSLLITREGKTRKKQKKNKMLRGGFMML